MVHISFFSFLCLTKCVSGMSVNFPVEESTLGCFNSSCFLQTSACLCQILRKKHFSSSCFHKLFQNYFYLEINIEARVPKLEFLWKCFCKIDTYFWYFCVFDVTRTQGRTESHIFGGVLSQGNPIFYLAISNSFFKFLRLLSRNRGWFLCTGHFITYNVQLLVNTYS